MPAPDPHCRIGRITVKKGGASVRVLRPTDDGSAAATIAALREHVDHMAGMFADDAAGFVLVMWDRAGRYSRGRRSSTGSPWGHRLVPAFVHEILLQDTAASVAHDVLNGKSDLL